MLDSQKITECSHEEFNWHLKNSPFVTFLKEKEIIRIYSELYARLGSTNIDLSINERENTIKRIFPLRGLID